MFPQQKREETAAASGAWGSTAASLAAFTRWFTAVEVSLDSPRVLMSTWHQLSRPPGDQKKHGEQL